MGKKRQETKKDGRAEKREKSLAKGVRKKEYRPLKGIRQRLAYHWH
jgi:hypothetical protein